MLILSDISYEEGIWMVKLSIVKKDNVAKLSDFVSKPQYDKLNSPYEYGEPLVFSLKEENPNNLLEKIQQIQAFYRRIHKVYVLGKLRARRA